MTNAMTPARYVESLFGLDGKLAVVTGASRGIGLAISQAAGWPADSLATSLTDINLPPSETDPS